MNTSAALFYPPSPSPVDSSSSMSRINAPRYASAYDVPMDSALLGHDYMSSPLSPDEPAAASALPVIKATPSKHPRLCALDAFRGITIALMIWSDEIGPAWTNIMDHAPWDGLHSADFVFPAFVFIVGMAIPMSTRRYAEDRWGVTRKAAWRSAKMFLVGFLAATGGFPAKYNLAHIRIPGILQRIAFCYLVTVLIHVWVPLRSSEEDDHRDEDSETFLQSARRLLNKYAYQWGAALAILILWLVIVFATAVPGCPRGALDEECNATAYWDRQIIGEAHMYAHPTLQRSVPCSLNSPALTPRPDAPAWCWRPYDPEGIVGSFTACITAFFGLWFGHVLTNESSPRRRLQHWLSLGSVCMAIGLILHFSTAIPINKNLWSLSYVMIMVGVDAAVFSFFYFLLDMNSSSSSGPAVTDAYLAPAAAPPARVNWQRVLYPFICMGMNAILVFVIAQSEISVDTVMQWFYLNDNPDNNLYHWYRVGFLNHYVGMSWAHFLWALTKVIAWLIISVFLARRKIFWKL